MSVKWLSAMILALVLSACRPAADEGPPEGPAGESDLVGDTTYEGRLARWRRDSTVIDSIGSSIPVQPLVSAMLVWRRDPGNPRLHEAVFCERFKLLRHYGAMPSARAEVRAEALAGLSDDERTRVRELPALVPGDCESGGTRARARSRDSMRLDRLEPRPVP